MGIFSALSFRTLLYKCNFLFAFITLFGPIALYRVFSDYFAQTSRIPVLLGIFFIPSFLYWTSGLHKEGLLFNSIALIIYVFYFGLKQGSFGWRRIAVVLLSLLVLLVLRNYIVMLLLPALLAWLAAQRLPWKPVLTFSLIYLLFAAFFFAAPYISPGLDFPAAIAGKATAVFTIKRKQRRAGAKAGAYRPGSFYEMRRKR
jgi:hypothetical protein